MLERLPGFIVPAAVAVVVLAAVLGLVFGVLVPSCSRTGGESQASAGSQVASQGDASASSQSASASSAEGEPAVSSLSHASGQTGADAQTITETTAQIAALAKSNSHIATLVELLGEEEAGKLVAQAKTSPDALWIASHPESYDFDGYEVQYKILKLAADEPASIPYVRGFPVKYPMADEATDPSIAMEADSPSADVPSTAIPHLYQWDRRWAYTIYSSATFGLTGCGPTSLAMVYQGLNKTTDRSPHDIAVMAEEQGYMSEFNGTDSAFFINVAGELGLDCWEASPDAESIREELSQGRVMIVNLGPGYFTDNGHFFVLAGLAPDGKVIVNDPYSVVRSSQTWDVDFIAAESIAAFVYAKA